MSGRWWVGVAAGLALGLGTVIAVEGATEEASAQSSRTVTFSAFKRTQQVAIVGVRRANVADKRLDAVEPKLPLWAVSSGGAGSNLTRGYGAVSAQRISEGNYRVRFNKSVAACTWIGSLSSDLGSVPSGFSIRVTIDKTDGSGAQLVVRTDDPRKGVDPQTDSAFMVHVFC